MKRPLTKGYPPESVYGRHAGETIIVIGNSASLSGMDLQVFDGYTTIGLNRLLRVYRPIYLMVVDQSVLRAEHARMSEASGDVQMLIYPLAMTSTMLRLYAGPWISTGPMNSTCDPTALRGPIHICTRGNSAYEAVQIAYRMGAKRILLAGVDMYWPPGKDSHFFGSGAKEGCTLMQEDAIRKDFLRLKGLYAALGVEMCSISPWKTRFRDMMGYIDPATLADSWDFPANSDE